jgi:hypothetical protein
MSSIGQVELLAAFQKAGWASPTTASGSMFDAKYESISFPIGKGKLKGRVMLVRPTSSPAEKANPLVPPAELPAATNKETSAFVYDEPAAVFLSVEITAGGKAADAQKLVDVLVTKTR